MNRILRMGFLLGLTVFGLGSRGCDEKQPMARHAMVSAAHPLAVEAGVEVLRRGGNAMDAAVTVGFALAVVEPHSAGIGGGGFLVYYNAKKDEVSVLDYRETASKKMKPWVDEAADGIKAEDYKYGGLSVGVPGMVKGMVEAHEKYGRLDFSSLLEPAIQAAEEGFDRTEKFKEVVESSESLLLKDPIAREIFLRKRIAGYAPRKKYVQPDLADTLRAIRDQGVEAFYGLTAARKIAAAVQEDGGDLTAEDIEAYRTKSRKALQGSYRGYGIETMCPPSAGGMTLLLALKLLEPYDLGAMGPDSPHALALIVRAHDLAARFCRDHVADPDMEKVPVDVLLKDDWLKLVLPKMPFQPGTRPSDLPRVGSYRTQVRPLMHAEDPGNTTHFSIVDQEGNMVAITQTINYSFGSGIVVPGMGIILNNEVFDFTFKEDSVNRPQPGKIPRSNMSPTIILKDGKPIATVGTPGGPRIPAALLQVLIQKIDFGATMQEAIAAPRVYYDRGNRRLNYEARIPDETMTKTVRLLGGDSFDYSLVRKAPFDRYFGGAHGIWRRNVTVDGQAHAVLEGGADPRRDGVALGF